MTKTPTLRSREEGRDSIQKTGGKRPTVHLQSGSPRSALPHAVRSAILALLEELPDMPDARRIELRNALASLARAFPYLKLDEVQLAQELAEEDGDEVDG